MNHTQKITSLSVIAGMFLIATLVTTVSRTETALAQNMSNQTVVNQSGFTNESNIDKPDRKQAKTYNIRCQDISHPVIRCCIGNIE